MRTLFRLLVTAAMTCVTSTAFAGSYSATMAVSVNVIARAVVTVESQPASVEVTKADIARGYVDLSAPMVVAVKTNSRSGYLLQVDQQSGEFSGVELTFGDASMSVNGAESWISRPYVQGGELLSMKVRVHLAAGTEPGSYPLPIALTARPL